ASAASTAEVASAPLAVHAIDLNATEGALFAGQVATFVDTVPFSAAGDYSATIDWGDGHASPGSVVADTQVVGEFDVTGCNTYPRFGAYPVTITINSRGHATATRVLADVADAPLVASGRGIRATAGTAFTGTVASFNDPDPVGGASDYAATVFWGDGHTSIGTI